MRVVVTGAAGFVGRRLASELAAHAALGGKPIRNLVLVDRVAPRVVGSDNVATSTVVGDLRDAHVRDEIFRERVDGIFHLAATMTADAERDFDAGIAFNMYGFHELLEACRKHRDVRLVFASSNAAFGGPLPEVVTDETRQRPQSSYGVQKVICELLIDDYTRRGFLDGRAMRLPTVLLRPPGGTVTLSSHMSAVVCEPLAGRKVICPFAPETRIPAGSPGAVARALIRIFEMPSEAIGAVRTMNFTALPVTIAGIVEALKRRIGTRADDLIEWKIDPHMTRIVQSMAGAMSSERGRAAGAVADPSFDAIIDDYLASHSG